MEKMPQLEYFALTMDSNFVLGSVQFSTSSKEIRNKCFEFAQRRQNETPPSRIGTKESTPRFARISKQNLESERGRGRKRAFKGITWNPPRGWIEVGLRKCKFIRADLQFLDILLSPL